MATLTAAHAASTFPVYKGVGAGMLCTAFGVYTLAANPTAADIIQFCKIPAGATIVGGWVNAADIDTGTEALDIDIGWAANGVEVADPDGLGNFGVWNGDVLGTASGNNLATTAANQMLLQGVLLTAGPPSFSAETMIQGVVNAPANAGGTGQITVVVLYVVG